MSRRASLLSTCKTFLCRNSFPSPPPNPTELKALLTAPWTAIDVKKPAGLELIFLHPGGIWWLGAESNRLGRSHSLASAASVACYSTLGRRGTTSARSAIAANTDLNQSLQDYSGLE